MQKKTAILISDFNLSNFQALLNLDESNPIVIADIIPFGQVMRYLLDGNNEIWKNKYDVAIIWAQPESIVNSYSDLFRNIELNDNILIEEVDQFINSIFNIADKVKSVFIPLWNKPLHLRGSGLLSFKSGFDYAIIKMNERLTSRLAKSNNIHVLDTNRWINTVGVNAYNPKSWYMGKIPYSNLVFKEAIKDIKASLIAIYGESKKVILVDLDDTLWGGIVGDDGWQNLKLGGHDRVGEAYLDFQKGLKYFKNRGLILGIVSKNEEKIALDAIDSHTEMVLKKSDFSAFRINWKDKASNIIEIANELNVGLQSIVFIDDNPFERELVREVLPEVFVPEWPKDPMLYYSSLISMPCFDVVTLSSEDLLRSQMYSIEEKRSQLKSQMTSIDDWINSLEMKIKIEKVGISNIVRVVQLFNKTNQMNLATRRFSESELKTLCEKGNNFIYCIKVEDKFGDYGLTGIIGLEKNKNSLLVTDFVLSCRVMGRKVEETMLNFIISKAEFFKVSNVQAEFLPTSKNKPCLDFFRKQKFNESNYVFEIKISNKLQIPSGIKVECNI
jgi:FkbH-like protein